MITKENKKLLNIKNKKSDKNDSDQQSSGQSEQIVRETV